MTAPKTTDSSSYYSRYGSKKKSFIKNFVLNTASNIRRIYDVGCNNGDMSYQFVKHGIDVLGVDASKDLKTPAGYNFKYMDITQDNQVYFNDCTLFLSLYHHILGACGLEKADTLFFQLLLRTRYLIFDTGNISELKRNDTVWYKKQNKLFCSEKELLDHFGLPYTIIGTWNVAGGSRMVCVFQKSDFDSTVKKIEEFRRQPGRKKAKCGLTFVTALQKDTEYFSNTLFYKLSLGKHTFFAKKWLDTKQESIERECIVDAYSKIDKEKLLVFYGISSMYGLIYEWVEQITWKKKLKNTDIQGFHFHDGDLVIANGKTKFIDFWSAHDPAVSPAPDDADHLVSPMNAKSSDTDPKTAAPNKKKQHYILTRCQQMMHGLLARFKKK